MALTNHFLNNLPQYPGVYLFKNRAGEILYIGKAKNLKIRIKSYFRQQQNRKTQLLVLQITDIETIPVESEFEALILEANLIKKYKPKFNVIWRDDKSYIYIQITDEEFPRVLLVRRPKLISRNIFGPYPSKKIVEDTLFSLRKIFPYCTQKLPSPRVCFYHHLGLCDPCPAYIVRLSGDLYKKEKKEYKKNIDNLKLILSGKISSLRSNLEKEMKKYSQVEEFEKAAVCREKLRQLSYLTLSYHTIEDYIKDPFFIIKKWKKEQDSLREVLKPYFSNLNKVRRIECYDVSNILGKFATGSMVTFEEGQPIKKLYRRFRIRQTTMRDDFSFLSEIIKRRIKHKEWKLPDLIVVDGGKPQLAAIIKIMERYQIKIPLIGLAKKEEEIVLPVSNYLKIKLPQESLALHLLKRVRDEAHRFARKYHSFLRLQDLVEYNN